MALNEFHESEDDSEVITLNESKRPQLEAKLEEYKNRLDRYKAPELDRDTHYKIAILEEVLKTGLVSKAEMKQILKRQYEHLDGYTFNSAFGVINTYNSGKGNIRGGTGLPGV